MENHWHICTDGLEKNVIFKSRKDYIAGMNGIPVCAVGSQVTILAFCLMSNHVHFIVRGTETGCRNFIIRYKRRISSLAYVRNIEVSIKRIDSMDYLMKAIGYVLRNPISAGIRVMPLYYEWSSASLYFRNPKSIRHNWSRKISSLSYRAKREILHAQTDLFDELPVSEEGMIPKEYYVDITAVEKIFQSPARLMFAISRNVNMDMEMDGDILHKTRYSDNELTEPIKDICRQTFNKSSVEMLNIEQRYRLAKTLHRRYGLTRKQLARLTMTDPELLKSML